MCSSIKLLITILIALSFHSSTLCQESQLINQINNNELEWDVIKTGWPVEDPSDTRADKRSQFFYIKDKDNANPQHWKFNDTYVTAIKNLAKTFKISLKYWIHTINRDQNKPNVQYKHSFSHDVYGEYSDGNYGGHWMEQEFSMSSDELSSFQLTNNPTDDKNVIALKDYTLEYETKNEIRTDFSVPTNEPTTAGLHRKDWSKYLNPPEFDASMDKNGEYLYFSDECAAHSCLLNSNNFPAHTDAKAELSFWYWVDRKAGDAHTRIEINSKLPDNFLADNSWHKAELNGIADPRGISVAIFTTSAQVDDHSFVAIKDLKVIVHYKESGSDRSQIFDCSQTDCLWSLGGFSSLLWAKHMTPLTTNIFYYPRYENNSLEYFSHNVDMNDVDQCFLLEYFTAIEKDLVIKVGYNIKGENYRDTIASIRPKVGQIDSAFLCVRDLIALNAKDFIVSIAVQQYDYRDGVNGFAMRVTEGTRNSILGTTLDQVWHFEDELLAFLTQWSEIHYTGLLRWPDEWQSLNKEFSSYFSYSENAIKFIATATRHTPTSAHLISKWIKYDPKLHDIDPQFSIHALNTAIFHSFTVTPKVCDWLMHCVDVVLEDRNTVASALRTYKFKFPTMQHSKYIKLVFYIEYYLPMSNEDQSTYTVEFDLKLVHFGDPCYSYADHCKGMDVPAVCTSDKHDLVNTVPNEPNCMCSHTDWYNGDCKTINYCSKPVPPATSGESMGKRCESIGLYCENIRNSDGSYTKAKCLCNDATINWDETKHECVEPPISPTNWNESGVHAGYHYPTNANNKLMINFTKIDITKYDVCLLIDYHSTKVVSLRADYVYQNSQKPMFNIALTNELTDRSFRVCMRDFVYTIHEDFALAFTVSHPAVTDWTDEATFSLHYTPSLQPKSQPIKYLRNWQHTTDVNWNDWVSFIPDKSFVRSTASDQRRQLKFTALISGQTVSVATMTSEWIEFNQNLTQQKNLLSIKYTQASKRYFNVTIKILKNHNGETQNTSEIFPSINIPADSSGIVVAEKTAFPITGMSPGDQFKFIIEISYAHPDSAPVPPVTLDIEFVEFSIGDPCYDLTGNKFVCQNGGVCSGYAPLNFSCVCTGDEYSGTYCTQPNYCKTDVQTFCNNFPAIPLDMLKHDTSRVTCLSNYATNKRQCVCASGDYYWSDLAERCLRKSYRKTAVHCVGPLNDSMTSCPFMNASRTDFEWSNSNLPPINKATYSLLPFYYPRKANSELKIAVRNLNVKTEACFKFHYYITDGSRLHIRFNNHPIVDLTPTRVYYPNVNKEFTDWLPNTDAEVETICLRKYFFANNITDYYDVTFVANITNLSNNMIALKFIGNDDTKNYMTYSERPFELMSELPYLIHWSKQYHTILDRPDDDPAVNSTNFEFDNQWPLRFPSKLWTHDESGHLDTVTFRGSLTSVESVAYLMSNWMQKNIDGYKLRFRISSITKFLHFAIETRVYDNTMKVVQSFPNHRIGDSLILANAAIVADSTLTQIYHIDKVNTSFRVGFTVHFKLRQNERHSDVEFRLESIDVGDPCVYDDTTFNGCSDHGYCTRLGPVDKHDCHCPAGWDINKENCDTTDWCNYKHSIDSDSMTGKEFCSAHNAGECWNLVRTSGGLRFQCNCSADVTEWLADERKCEKIPRCPLSNKCVAHIEKCVEPVGTSVEPTCECNDALGYHSFRSADNLTNVCELVDPCNARHNPDLCGNSRAQCFRSGPATKVGNIVDGYVCVCPRGYKTNSIHAKQNTICTSVMCEFHGLNNCQQKCTNSDTSSVGYTCGCYNDEIYAVSATNSSECTLRPDKQCSCQNATISYYCNTNSGDQCSCQTGYQYSSNNTCEPSTTIIPAICPDGKTKEENGVLVCDCNDALYLRNEVDHHCDLKPICGEGSQGRANCEAKNAKCVSDENEIGNYRCECPLGKIFENGLSTTRSKDDPMNYTCIDYCAVSKREEICELINAKCDASKVFDSSNGQLLELHDLYDFCECKPGYVRVQNAVGFECSLAPSTYELKLLIKDTFKYNNVTITNERLVHISRETSRRRKKRQSGAYESLNDANSHGFYNDFNSSFHLNKQLDSESVVNINKAEFAKLLSTRLFMILNETEIGNKLRSVTVESCLLNADRYYDCVFSVTLHSSLEHKDEIASHLDAVCEKQSSSDDCYIRHASNSDPLVFKSTSFIVDVYDPCDTKRSAVNCPEYTTCKSINYPNNSYYACVCDPEYFDVKSNRTIRNEDHSLVTYIDSCRPKDLCSMNCRAIMTDGGRCEQEQPRLENNKWIIPRPKCICGTNSKVLAENGLSCYEPCSPTLCHNHGDCHVMNVNPYYVCACRDGWSGAQCDHDSASKSRTGWIVSVVILAVLLLVAIGLALGFAYKYKQSSMRTKQSSGFMNKRISLEDLQSSQAGGGGGGQQQSTMYSQQQSYH